MTLSSSLQLLGTICLFNEINELLHKLEMTIEPYCLFFLFIFLLFGMCYISACGCAVFWFQLIEHCVYLYLSIYSFIHSFISLFIFPSVFWDEQITTLHFGGKWFQLREHLCCFYDLTRISYDNPYCCTGLLWRTAKDGEHSLCGKGVGYVWRYYHPHLISKLHTNYPLKHSPLYLSAQLFNLQCSVMCVILVGGAWPTGLDKNLTFILHVPSSSHPYYPLSVMVRLQSCHSLASRLPYVIVSATSHVFIVKLTCKISCLILWTFVL